MTSPDAFRLTPQATGLLPLSWIMSDEPPELAPHDLELAKIEMGLGDRDECMRVIDVGRTVVLDVADAT